MITSVFLGEFLRFLYKQKQEKILWESIFKVSLRVSYLSIKMGAACPDQSATWRDDVAWVSQLLAVDERSSVEKFIHKIHVDKVCIKKDVEMYLYLYSSVVLEDHDPL